VTVNKTSGSDTFSGVISGAQGLIKEGAGTLALGGANTYSGATAVNDGTITLHNGGGLGDTAAGTTVAAGAQVRLVATNSGFTVGTESLTLSGQGMSTGGALRNAAGDNTWQGNITLAANATIGAAAGTSLTLDVATGGAITAADFNLTFDGAGTNRVLDAITLGSGGLTKIGSGTTILGASNNFTGATTVAAGKLIVDGSIAGSTVTVNNGGTLAGSGSVGGLIVNSGGTISPGNSPGNLTVAGNFQWNGGGNYNWQIIGTTGTPGTTWDLLTVTGTLDLSAFSVGNEFNINLWSLSSTGPDTNGRIANFNSTTSYEWLAVTASNITGFNAAHFAVNVGATNGTGGFSNPLDGGYLFGVRQDGGNLYVTYGQAAPIPEPGTWAAMAIFAGGAAYAGWRRRYQARPHLMNLPGDKLR
jgi:autotransporter-associated beta strand protein